MKVVSHAEAKRAIFVDFECLIEKKHPRPMLLGVLVGSDGEDFHQIITDERLAPARVARRETTLVVPTPDGVDGVVRLASEEERRIAGWSYFDRDRMIEACPHLSSEINARYINALHVARPWRQKLHPHVTIEREDEYAPRHTLDKYAALAGYSSARVLANATPAKWIRHTLQQLKANDGRYRPTTKQTKRDWHKVLEYNRHDCLALRHILIKAARELERWRAYEQTRFCVQDGRHEVCFKAGSVAPRLAALLERHHAKRWAFITAWNPGSVPLSRKENDVRQAQLRRIVHGEGYVALEGRGIGSDPSWEPEESLMILGISRDKAMRLGGRFGQLAIVVGERGSPPQLVRVAPD